MVSNENLIRFKKYDQILGVYTILKYITNCVQIIEKMNFCQYNLTSVKYQNKGKNFFRKFTFCFIFMHFFSEYSRNLVILALYQKLYLFYLDVEIKLPLRGRLAK